MSDGSASHGNLLLVRNLSVSTLTNNTLYFYNVSSCDESFTCATSGPFNFTTLQNVVVVSDVNSLSPASNTNVDRDSIAADPNYVILTANLSNGANNVNITFKMNLTEPSDITKVVPKITLPLAGSSVVQLITTLTFVIL